MNPAAPHNTIAALGRTTGRIARLVSRLSDPQLRSRDSPDEFSALENICHLRDIEIEGYTVRISRILAEAEPLLPNVDGGRLAAERDYNCEDLNPAVESFRLARANNIENLQALTTDQYHREGTLEGVGTISLGKLLEMMQEHDESHVRDMEIICHRFDRTSAESEI